MILASKILFVAATTKELGVIKTLYKNQSSPLKADFLVSWIWNIPTTLTCTKALSLENYDFVVNIWVCWYRETKEDLIQIVRSVYAPTMREILTPVFFEFAPLKAILCSETPIFQENVLWDLEYVDMESYATEKVCEHFKVPRIILKVPIDKVWKETEDFNFNCACEVLERSLDMKKLLESIETYISSRKWSSSIEKYLTHYTFTRSEEIIFEKAYHKYVSLSEQGFEAFFGKHKKKDKKTFLSELQIYLDTLSTL